MATTFRDLIAENKRKSALLVACFCLFVTVVAMVLGLAIIAYVSPGVIDQLDLKRGLMIGGVAAGISLFISYLSYYAGANFILAVSGAREIQHKDDPELFNLVEEMAIAAGVPMPKVYVMDDSAPNAFATGRDPQHAVVCVTTGLRRKLTRDELQGVIAHEIGHIRNFDIRLMLLMAVLVGTVAMLSDFLFQVLRFSGGSRHRDDRKKGGGPFAVVLIVLAVVLAIIAPILAQIIQFAVSRQREYLADASAVEFTRNPLGLAHALQKIDGDHDVLEAANRGTAHLFIANPIKKFEARAHTVFASHPPIKDRVQRLLALARQ